MNLERENLEYNSKIESERTESKELSREEKKSNWLKFGAM